MNIEEIRKNAPKGATHYYTNIVGRNHYAVIKKGRVYRISSGLEFYESWLKHFKYQLKPL